MWLLSVIDPYHVKDTEHVLYKDRQHAIANFKKKTADFQDDDGYYIGIERIKTTDYFLFFFFFKKVLTTE